MLVKGAADITDGLKHSGESMMTIVHEGVGESHEVQWLLCCYAALIAQELHRQLQGRQPASLPATATSTLQEQQESGQQAEQQERVKVAPMHKRLLEGLQVPGLIGWEHGGITNVEVWRAPQAYSAALACAVFNSQLAYVERDSSGSSIGSGSARVRQQPVRDPPLLTATVHLRRAAVLLELCLLFPELNVLLLSLECIHKEVECMYFCLRQEVGDIAATWHRVYAAVASGILPTVLQQLLPLLTRMLEMGSQHQGAGKEGFGRAAAELGIVLAGAMPGGCCGLLVHMLRLRAAA
jgi:hypothetical protein